MSDEVTTPPPAAPSAAPTATAPEAAAPAPEPVKSGRGKQIRNQIIRIVAVPAVVIVGGIVWAFASGDPTMANTGDCLIGQQADDIKIVGCDDATAEWKVVGKVDNVSEAEYSASQDDTHCSAYSTATASFWSGKKRGNGDVLCLEPLKK